MAVLRTGFDMVLILPRTLRAVVAAAATLGVAATAADPGSLRIEAGRRLFFDARLSEPPGTSCASCHDPARAFTGDNGSGTAVARGSRPGERGTRNSPTLMYLAAAPSFGWRERDGRRAPAGGLFWDGRATGFADQARFPLLAANEMNNTSIAAVVAKVAAAEYAALLRAAWGDGVFAATDSAWTAIAASLESFQRSAEFAPFTSKFDAVLRGQARFTEEEERGQSLFLIAQKGNCASCHTLNADSRRPEDSLFTDFGYHVLGVPRNAEVARTGAYDLGLCGPARGDLAGEMQWCGSFRTPTLRNVARTAPYMHNGRFATLREAVAFYATRDTEPQRWYPQGETFDDLPPPLRGNVDRDTRPYHRTPGQRPALRDDEVDDIVAFLQTLTDGFSGRP
jgi:cytochrome c peroxidase